MANTRTKFDMIGEYLSRTQDGVETATLYRKPGLRRNMEPFALFHRDGMAFRLHGRTLVSALTLPGAQPFDPLTPDKPPPGWPGWVWVPPSQMIRWDRLSTEALRCLREANEKTRVSWKVPEPMPPAPPELPPSPPGSLADRVKKFLAGNSWSKWLS